MTGYEVPTTTASSSSKAPSSIGALVLVKSSKPKIGQPSVRPDPPALQYPCDTLTGCENASCRWRLRRQDLGHAAPCFSVLLEVSGRFEEILLGYAVKLWYPGSGASAKDTIFGAFEESGNDTSNDGSSFPSHGDGELRRQLASLENQLASNNKHLNSLLDEKAALAKENSALLKENEELRRRVPSAGSGSKRGQDDFRARSNSRGRSERSRSREPSSGRHLGGSKKRSLKKKVNYDSDR